MRAISWDRLVWGYLPFGGPLSVIERAFSAATEPAPGPHHWTFTNLVRWRTHRGDARMPGAPGLTSVQSGANRKGTRRTTVA